LRFSRPSRFGGEPFQAYDAKRMMPKGLR
jgi:hypothetical protein